MPAAPTLAVSNRHPRLGFRRNEVVRLFRVLHEGRSALRAPRSALAGGELSVVFLTDAALAALHGEFMDDPATTDVITFGGDPAAGVAGEICVSVDTAATFAREHRGDFATELTLYLVHGWLHLAGHDDLVPSKKRRMRAAEKRALALLRAADAIPAFRLNL